MKYPAWLGPLYVAYNIFHNSVGTADDQLDFTDLVNFTKGLKGGGVEDNEAAGRDLVRGVAREQLGSGASLRTVQACSFVLSIHWGTLNREKVKRCLIKLSRFLRIFFLIAIYIPHWNNNFEALSEKGKEILWTNLFNAFCIWFGVTAVFTVQV